MPPQRFFWRVFPTVTVVDESAAPPSVRPERTACGFVAVVGAPNVGKSTLVNRLVGSKISIVSPKVQTTRSRVLGIVVRGSAQLVLVDTPGIFKPRRRLDRAMVAAAWSGVADADVVLLMIDSVRGLDADTGRIIERLKNGRGLAVIALNKIDLVSKPALLALTAALQQAGPFPDVFMVSAATGDGIDDLAADLVTRLPAGPWLYPADQLSDMPMRLLAAEITREQMFLQLHRELPYACAVETETWTEHADGSIRISQVVYVERDNHKAIVLGKGGRRIKTIGIASRIELERLLERRIHLLVHVKVRRDWGEDPERYRDLGLEFKA